MAVVLMMGDGCVLDHARAIASAYSQCNCPSSLLSSVQCCVDEKEDEDQVKDASDICSGDPLQSLESVKGSQQDLTGKNIDECKCDIAVSKHLTAATNHDVTVENSSVVASERIASLPEHFVHKHTTSKSSLKQCIESVCAQEHTVNDAIENCVGKRKGLSSQFQYNAETPDSKKQANGIINSAAGILENERLGCPTDMCESETATCKSVRLEQLKETRLERRHFSHVSTDCPHTSLPHDSKLRKLSLRLKQGFFAVKVPFMMDSQFEKVKNHFMQEDDGHRECRKDIGVADVLQVLQTKKRKRKSEKKTRSAGETEEMLHKVHTSLVQSARERGLFLKNILLPLDNNLSSRQHGQMDGLADVFTSLLVTSDGTPILHMGEPLKPLVIQGCDTVTFSAAELIHRRVSHKSTESSVVNVEGTGYVLPPCSEFLVSNLQDLCDHLFLELDENSYDLIVMDPPWENKSVKRKKSYDMVSEAQLQRLPLSYLTRPGGLVAVWVTNNERLEDYCLHTLFPVWGLTTVARWHWLKVTQTGDLISSMEADKKPYEVLLLARAAGSGEEEEQGRQGVTSVPCSLHSEEVEQGRQGVTSVPCSLHSEEVEQGRQGVTSVPCSLHSEEVEQGRQGVPQWRVVTSVPCSLHSKKPPLTDVLQPYLPASPKCLELFARNMWPQWTSWGREVLKHQNLMFYEATDNR